MIFYIFQSTNDSPKNIIDIQIYTWDISCIYHVYQTWHILILTKLLTQLGRQRWPWGFCVEMATCLGRGALQFARLASNQAATSRSVLDHPLTRNKNSNDAEEKALTLEGQRVTATEEKTCHILITSNYTFQHLKQILEYVHYDIWNMMVNMMNHYMSSSNAINIQISCSMPSNHRGNDPLRKLQTELEALKRWELQAGLEHVFLSKIPGKIDGFL